MQTPDLRSNPSRWVVSVAFWALALILATGCGGGGGPPEEPTEPEQEGDPVPPASDEPEGTGYIPDDPGVFDGTPENDARMSTPEDTPEDDGRLPERVDLREELPDLDSQQPGGSCVAWSLAYFNKTAIERMEEGWNVQGDTECVFSPAFLCRMASDSTSGQAQCQYGMCFSSALAVLESAGCCRWPEMPGDDCCGYVPQTALDEAAGFRADGHVRFGTEDGLSDAAIEEMKGWLANDRVPISIATEWDTPMLEYRGEDYGVILNAAGTSDLPSGHATTIVGYDDNIPAPNTGAFLLVNSYGAEWGMNGFAWIPYEELNKIYLVGYGILDLPNDTAPLPPSGAHNVIYLAADLGAPNPHVSFDGTVHRGAGDPADWLKFEAIEGQVVELELSGFTADADLKLVSARSPPPSGLTADADLRLFNFRDRRLAASQQWGTTAESLVYTIPEDGTYYVKVHARENAQTPYTLDVTLHDGGTDNDDDVVEGALEISLGETRNGSVQGRDGWDWWKLTLADPAQVKMTLLGVAADLDLSVYRRSDLAAGDAWLRSREGGAFREEITFTGSPSEGPYYLRVDRYGRSWGAYQLTAKDVSWQANLKAVAWDVDVRTTSLTIEVAVNRMMVANTGMGDAGEFSVRVGIADGTDPTDASRWGSKILFRATGGTTVVAGKARTWTGKSVTLNKSSLPSTGTYHLYCHVDSEDQVSEPNEMDNYRFTPNATVDVE